MDDFDIVIREPTGFDILLDSGGAPPVTTDVFIIWTCEDDD